MTRRRTAPQVPQEPIDPFDAAVLKDDAHLADELTAILEATEGFETSAILGKVFLKHANGSGPWSWCDDVVPPWNLAQLFEDMRERFGAGNYQLRIFAKGKIRKNIDFSIAKERVALSPPPPQFGGDDQFSKMLILMMNQNQQSADRQMTMMQTMSAQSNDMLGKILPAIIGANGNNRGGEVSETVALIKALTSNNNGGGIRDTIEAMAAMKKLIGSDNDGDRPAGMDLDDLAGSAVRLIGPGVKALGDYMAKNKTVPVDHSDLAARQLAGNGEMLALPPSASRYRVIELVRADLNYMFERGYAPEKVADMIYDILAANQVQEAEIYEIAAAFAISANGLDDLAAEGIDLRARPGWSAAFFEELRAIHTAETDSAGGGGGGAAHAEGNGEAGAGRNQGSDDTQ